jgi:dipeptidyl-peptidase-4
MKVIADKKGTSSAQFSSTFDYYVLSHSDINTPSSYVVHSNDGKALRSIVDNKKVKKLMTEHGVTSVEFMEVPTDDGVKLNAYIMKPNNFDPSKKYPVFMYVYGGPGSQTVTNSWKGQNYWWFQKLVAEDYIVVSVDNRGTGARGEAFKKMTYKELGKYEIQDQINAAKYLASMDYVDGERIGMFGWSYGGYMSSLAITKGADVFKAAIAVAPVTNWKWYDTIYTERYMQTSNLNPNGYEDNSPVNFAELLEGNYLLVHGNSDDNVHFQHSAEMAAALIAANKQFDTYFYPNRNHGIYGDNARIHLYTKMHDFILENL